ncbi:DUF4366 domain-containing protein [Clostridium sp. MD294]|uniref:DUF4366 domain-containing protein n=1 Tax=Clostridium sp. MD294 TaxID=97138 RepID=UPI0002CC1546|nr:DUF4366 domain-containing protein [Clostridium sp. MD294]NDO47852.1 DUF4366 domain-containing protein [Clostridium sp. MD294]USF29827.1 hypothetical protein C820_001235 [Clostridium sp. MD294]
MKKNSIKYFTVMFLYIFIMLLPIQAIAMVQTQTTTPASASMDSENKPDTTPRGFTPKGNATVVDDVKTENEKEFFTISTPNENIFYLIVDRARESENVYFLNEVTEQDLFSLTSAEKPKETALPEQKETICNCTQKCAVGMVNTQCELCSVNLKKCIGIDVNEQNAEETAKKEQSNTQNEKGTVIFSIVGIVIAVTTGYYFKVYRPKQEYIDDDDEETEENIVNEYEQENKEEIFVNEDDIEEEKNKTSGVEYYDDVPDEYIDN